MAIQTVKAMVAGGKASAAPPLGNNLGPLGVNIGQVVADINKKTAVFNGMQVPVTINVDSDTKKHEIEIGTPPASALILKEASIEKGSGNPLQDKVADIRIEQVIKISKMKEDGLLGRSLKEKVKEIIGTCNSMGIMVEGKQASEVIKEINKGSFSKEIAEEKTELSAEELKELEQERKKLAAEMEARKAEYTATAKEIIESLAGKTRGEIKTKLVEAGIPTVMINELLPVSGAGVASGAATEKDAKEKPKEQA